MRCTGSELGSGQCSAGEAWRRAPGQRRRPGKLGPGQPTSSSLAPASWARWCSAGELAHSGATMPASSTMSTGPRRRAAARRGGAARGEENRAMLKGLRPGPSAGQHLGGRSRASAHPHGPCPAGPARPRGRRRGVPMIAGIYRCAGGADEEVDGPDRLVNDAPTRPAAWSGRRLPGIPALLVPGSTASGRGRRVAGWIRPGRGIQLGRGPAPKSGGPRPSGGGAGPGRRTGRRRLGSCSSRSS